MAARIGTHFQIYRTLSFVFLCVFLCFDVFITMIMDREDGCVDLIPKGNDLEGALRLALACSFPSFHFIFLHVWSQFLCEMWLTAILSHFGL